MGSDIAHSIVRSETNTLWLFGDTFQGKVWNGTRIVKGYPLNSNVALRHRRTPTPGGRDPSSQGTADCGGTAPTSRTNREPPANTIGSRTDCCSAMNWYYSPLPWVKMLSPGGWTGLYHCIASGDLYTCDKPMVIWSTGLLELQAYTYLLQFRENILRVNGK